MSPKVSVVIPAWNAAAFIEKTLDSVAAQTLKDYEVVVVDDGSSDDTSAVVTRWLERTKTPGRCITQANKKIAGARNTGMRAAQGTFVALLDHDDLWYPEKLAVSMAELEAHPDVDLVCHWENVVKDGKTLRVAMNGPEEAATYEALLFKGNALSPSGSTFKREKALSIGGFREDPQFNTVEDYDFWMRLARVAKFRFIPKALGEYQVVERAASRRVVYHHDATEALLRDHFKTLYGDAPGLAARLKMRRRLSAVYRSALGQLLERGTEPELRRSYCAKMMSAFPFEPKNLARALQTWIS